MVNKKWPLGSRIGGVKNFSDESEAATGSAENAATRSSTEKLRRKVLSRPSLERTPLLKLQRRPEAGKLCSTRRPLFSAKGKMNIVLEIKNLY